jgi:hypothetical protein
VLDWSALYDRRLVNRGEPCRARAAGRFTCLRFNGSGRFDVSSPLAVPEQLDNGIPREFGRARRPYRQRDGCFQAVLITGVLVLGQRFDSWNPGGVNDAVYSREFYSIIFPVMLRLSQRT